LNVGNNDNYLNDIRNQTQDIRDDGSVRDGLDSIMNGAGNNNNGNVGAGAA